MRRSGLRGTRRTRITRGISGFGGGISGGPVVTTFGTLTLEGDGGVSVSGTSIDSGDPLGHWQILSGRISPSTAGAAANLSGAPYSMVLNNGQSVDVTTEAATYSTLADETEVDAAFDDIVATAPGAVTVKSRAGTISNPSAALTDTRAFTAKVTWTGESGFKISLTGTNSLTMKNTANFELNGFEVVSDGTSGITPIIVFKGPTCTDNGCDGMTIHGGFRDPLGDYSAGYSNSSYGIQCQTSGGYPSDFYIKNCLIYDVDVGVSVFSNNSMVINDNEIYNTYEDAIKPNVDATTTSVLTGTTDVSRNVMYNFLSDPTDTGNPHADAIQFLNNGNGEWNGVTCNQNIILQDTSASRGRNVQGIANFDSQTTDKMIEAEFKGNIIILDDIVHGITIDDLDGGRFIGNTIAKYDPDAGETSILGMQIAEDSAGSNTVYVWQNIAEAINLNTAAGVADSQRNVILGLNGATNAYSDVFDSATFTPSTVAEILARYTMKPFGPADQDGSGTPSVGDSGAIGTGYATYGNPRDNGTGWSLDADYEPSAYTANAVEFDGTNDYLTETAFAGTGNSKVFMASCYLYVPTTWPSANERIFTIQNAGTDRLLLRFVSSSRLAIEAKDSSNTVIVSAVSNTGPLSVDTWHHVAFWVDTAAGTAEMYFDAVEPTYLVQSVTTDGILDTGLNRAIVGASNTGGSGLSNFYIADLYVNSFESLDLGVTANIEKLRGSDGKPVDLGSDGSTPTGSQPDLFLSGDTATWHTNDGFGGGLTENGALTTAPSSPSD